MALDGEKLRKLRTTKGISQEKLALMCRVNKRTIQRAEKGEPVAMETAAFIAEAVGVSPTSLKPVQIEMFEPTKKAWNDVVLVPTSSGRRIVDLLRQSFESELTFDVEPTTENIKPLAQLASLLEPFQPAPWEPPHERYDPRYAEVLEKQAEVNTILAELTGMGISVFVGTYLSFRQIPRYDMDEGHMYVGYRTPREEVQIGIAVTSDTNSKHLVRQPSDVCPPDDEIPF